MILLAVDLESLLETTSNSIGRGEDGVDAPLLFLGFLGLWRLLVPSSFTLVVAPADPKVFVPICDVVEGEGGCSIGRAGASGFQ